MFLTPDWDGPAPPESRAAYRFRILINVAAGHYYLLLLSINNNNNAYRDSAHQTAIINMPSVTTPDPVAAHVAHFEGQVPLQQGTLATTLRDLALAVGWCDLRVLMLEGTKWAVLVGHKRKEVSGVGEDLLQRRGG